MSFRKPRLIIDKDDLFPQSNSLIVFFPNTAAIENSLKKAGLITSLSIISFTPRIMYKLTFSSEKQKTAFLLLSPLTLEFLETLDSRFETSYNKQ